MLSVAVCDDLEEERVNAARLLYAYGKRHGIPLRLDAYPSGAALLADYRPGRWQVIFLDIYMTPITGAQTARWIRSQDQECTLVFITASREHGLEGYELGVTDYLVKPCTQADMDRCMDWIMETQRERDRSIALYTEWREEMVLLRDIRYVEMRDHTAEIHLGDRVLPVNLTMKALEEAVAGGSFYRCHRSFLVNLAYVRKAEEREFLMEGGGEIPIAPNRRKEARDVFLRWMAENSW